ncbi:TPA: type VI secretion system Vgr family protein [Enterobacter hormaechei]|uniref:type VI secretion system Vgr family protein n=1 Tax=Enterobacter hormaechei TaxID=158836 RepID=UPI000666231A|nr:type VI secretion system tip protein VgrG [Enterobacter hormaechei]KTK14359.1 type IV secretion protein Rhs [Enterobacter hormaechei subsp. oharae]KTK19820.1 type IV secretion protein Rhs [Enterobacter hormaechei subsp. oharae]MBF9787685.1 type VI secretion system tip protein VgrG [Enterobacter hormaechei]MDL0020792.1 type VI secretion system tip protein VgrG [Enterobacter hormaechei]MDX7029782.1 type VI secretion system tip protein VgrG [Enterobacter hormaechei]
MSLTDTLNTMVTTVTGKALNRYRLDIPSCTADIDVEDFSGSEAMSELYCYTINFTSADKNIDARQMLSKPATLTMGAGNLLSLTDRKVVHGVVTRFERTGGSADEAHYCIVLEPFLALLGNQFRTHRFFVNKSVPEVVAEVLQEHGLKGWEYEFTLKADYPKREQINQYQENDLAFIERLLAEVGIFYFFTLQPDTQTEVVHFADKQSAWTFGKKLRLNSPSGMNDNAADSVWGVHVWHNVVERSVTACDYNHREAQNVLMSVPADMTRGDGEGNTYGDVYHYRPRHLERGDKITPSAETGNFWARLEHERFLSTQTTVTGSSTDHTLGPAQVLTITETAIPPTLPRETENGLVIISAGYSASRQSALKVEWAAMPYYDNRCWRPASKKRPVVSGTLMVRVTSAKDNDIYAWQDASGMYRVKFDADRDDKRQGQESMPVRFAKPYGGDKYGFHFPLIQGTEVAIAFHEGDPDRPYIAHALHDSRHVDHVTVANSTRNVIRTAGLNKLRMEDKRGEEHVKLSTEYGGKTQLNLGHNVDASRKLRGEGAELRTDRHVSIRGGAGVFITADKQPFAGDKMLSMQEAIAQLENALSIARSLSDAAETAQALPADIQSQVKLTDALKDLAQPGMVLNAPEGVSITSPQAIRMASGSASVGIMSQQNTDISALKRFTVAAGEAVSMLARKAGMKLFAAKGKVEIQAQDDALDAIAKKDVTVTSTEGRIEITAAKDVVLKNLDGSFIQLQGKNIILGCEGNILWKCANAQKMGSVSMSSVMPQFPSGYSGKFTASSDAGVPVAAAAYMLTSSNGQKLFGRTDENGETVPVYSSSPNESFELEMIQSDYWYDSENIVDRVHCTSFSDMSFQDDGCQCRVCEENKSA